MRQRSALMAFLLGSLQVGAASSLAVLGACNDFVTGQDPEPPGPLLVTRVTLLDPAGRDGHVVFTDTSAPLDCSLAQLKDTVACVNTPFKDMYSPKMSPPTPDSATKLRVVFNKIPAKLNGQDVETAPADGLAKDLSELKLIDPNVVSLSCDTCTGIPQSNNTLQVTGSDLSPDPTTFDYGPALQMQVLPSYDPSLGVSIADDPLRALEPATVYKLKLSPGLSGRNSDDKILVDDAANALLTFTTEPFSVIQSGIGDTIATGDDGGADDAKDLYVINSCNRGSGAVTDPFIIAAADGNCNYVDPTNTGVLALYLNAGVDHSAFQAGKTVTATVAVDGGTATAVPVMITNGHKVKGACDRGSQRTLYIAPTSGTWATGLAASSTAVVLVTVRGADIRDVSQDASHTAGMGRHVLSGDVLLQATIKGSNMAPDAVTAADVTACP